MTKVTFLIIFIIKLLFLIDMVLTRSESVFMTATALLRLTMDRIFLRVDVEEK